MEDDVINMAVSSPMSYGIPTLDYGTSTITDNVYNYDTATIKGQMITVDTELGLDQWEKALDREDIKYGMVAKIVGELIKNKCVEFTSQMDHINYIVKVRARIFATPDDQVRLIRTKG